MIKMVMDINKNNFDGKPVVQCYTCHRGSVTPATAFVVQDTLAPIKPYGKDNAQIDDVKFIKPASKPQPPRPQ